MVNFINTFLSYGVLLLVTVALAGIGVTIGINLRKRKADVPAEEGVKGA